MGLTCTNQKDLIQSNPNWASGTRALSPAVASAQDCALRLWHMSRRCPLCFENPPVRGSLLLWGDFWHKNGARGDADSPGPVGQLLGEGCLSMPDWERNPKLRWKSKAGGRVLYPAQLLPQGRCPIVSSDLRLINTRGGADLGSEAWRFLSKRRDRHRYIKNLP